MKTTYRDVCSYKNGHQRQYKESLILMKYPIRSLLMCSGHYIILQLKIDRLGHRLSISFLNCISYFWCYLPKVTTEYNITYPLRILFYLKRTVNGLTQA